MRNEGLADCGILNRLAAAVLRICCLSAMNCPSDRSVGAAGVDAPLSFDRVLDCAASYITQLYT